MAPVVSFVVLLCFLTTVSGYRVDSYTNDESRPGAHLIVISAPAWNDRYYRRNYRNIIRFDIGYAKKIMGKDNVVVLGDADAIQIFRYYLPDDILLEVKLRDVWMRDPTTVNPYDPVQFRLTPASYRDDQSMADEVQSIFTENFKPLGVKFDETPKKQGYFMDGGNVVDNYKDKIVITDRFLEDNSLTKDKGKELMKGFYRGVDKVAIVPTDDPKGLAHADGMVMFINSNTALVTNYNFNKTLKDLVWNELKTEFPGIDLLEDADTWRPEQYDKTISSACGLMVNGVLTENYLYVPTFGNPTDQSILDKIQAKTDREVVPVKASRVCKMGGSVRCLSWQQTGENAKKIIQEARYSIRMLPFHMKH